MKKLTFSAFILLTASMLLAGGLVTNTNQSADFIRMLNRNASTDMDAVYFNPAGVTSLAPGMHLYISSQTIWQDRTVTVFSPSFNSDTYEGSTFAPVFPNFYFTYNTGRVALSAGFQPIGGGGSAEFPNSLSSFDRVLAKYVGLPAAALNPALTGYTITKYDMSASFVGSSIYFGFQGNVAFKVSDALSVAAGLRYITANNSYEGGLSDPMLTVSNGSASMQVNPLAPITELNVLSERTGSGMCYVVGANLTLGSLANIGVHYETMTELVLTSNTTEDGTALIPDLDGGMFPDATDYNSDMPALLAVGAQVNVTPGLRLQPSFNYYFNTDVNWDGLELKTDDGYEYGLGAEMDVTSALTVSAGYLSGDNGAMDSYNEDISYALNSYTLGGGLVYRLSPKMAFTLGASNTFYETGTNGKSILLYKEDYDKTTFDVAVGIGYSF